MFNNSRNPTIDRNVSKISKSISLGAISLEPLIFQSFIKISCYTIFSYPIISSLSSVSATRFTNPKTLQSSSHVLKRLSISNSSSSKVKLHLYPHVDLKLINFIILHEQLLWSQQYSIHSKWHFLSLFVIMWLYSLVIHCAWSGLRVVNWCFRSISLRNLPPWNNWKI